MELLVKIAAFLGGCILAAAFPADTATRWAVLAGTSIVVLFWPVHD